MILPEPTGSLPSSPDPASSGSRKNDELVAVALIERERRAREFPLYYYEPSRKLAPFHKSRSIIRQICGANRVGKTETNTAEFCAYQLGYRPWVLRQMGLPMPNPPWVRPANLPDEALCFNGAGIRVQVPNTGLFFTGLSLKKGIGEVIAPKMRMLLGPLIQQEHMAHAGTPAAMTLKNGARAVFGSDEQDRMSKEGSAYTHIGVDEPIKKSTYVALRRGSIDHFAPMWFSYTPIGANSAWMFRDLYTKADGVRIFSVTASIWDNDYLTKEAIEEFANDPAISEAEKEARLYGRFQNLIDRIYPQFDPDVHVIPSFDPPSDWVRGVVIDPHSIKPWAIAFFAISTRGDIYFFKEWPSGDFTKIRRDAKSLPEYADLIRRLEGDHPSGLRLCDPNYGPRTDIIRGVMVESVVSQLAKHDLHFFHQLNDNLVFGEGRVRSLLSYDLHQPLGALNRPKLYITEDCPNCIASMSFYTAKARQGGDGESDEEKREEAYKDFADDVRYVAVSGAADMAASESFEPYTSNSEPEVRFDGTAYGEM